MKKIAKKMGIMLSAIALCANSVCFASTTGNEFGELAFESKLPNELVVYSSDFSAGTYVSSLEGLTIADLEGKDYIPVYDANDTWGSKNLSRAVVYTNDWYVPASAGCKLKDDGAHTSDLFIPVNSGAPANPTGAYRARPSGWYNGNAQVNTAGEYFELTSNGGNFTKTIQDFYKDFGPGDYTLSFKAKSTNVTLGAPVIAYKMNNYSQYTNYNFSGAVANFGSTNTLTGAWQTFSMNFTIPVCAGEFYETDEYTSDVFVFDIRTAGSTPKPFAIDDFKIVKKLATGDSVSDFVNQDLIVEHTIYANDNTETKDAVVITALYNAEGGLEDVSSQPVRIAADVASVKAQTTVEVPSTVTDAWKVYSYLWTDITENVAPYSLATDLFSDNLVRNGSFEIAVPDSTDNVAKYWKGRAGAPVVDATYAHTGKYSIKVDSATNKTFQYSKFTDDILVLGVGTYKISFWVKTDAVDGIKVMGLFRSNGGANQGAVYQTITAADGWVKLEAEHTVASFGDCGIILGYDGLTGNAWFDDVVVEKIN